MIGKILFAGDRAEALALLSKGDAVLYGGGTELNRLGSLIKAENAVVLAEPEGGISTRQGRIRYALGTTFQAAIDHPKTPAYMREALAFMGSLQKREAATIAGNLYLHRDDSYLVPTLLAAGAVVELDWKDEVSAEEYLASFDSFRQRIISCVSVPLKAPVVSKRIAMTKESLAVLTAAANPDFAWAAVKGTGIVKVGFSEVKCENCVARALREAGVRFVSDIYGSEEYKAYLTKTVLFDLHKEAGR